MALWSLAFAAAALVALAGVAHAEPATLAGVLLDAGTGEPVARASVTARHTPAKAVSDAEGRFTLSGLPAGPLTLHATADGYAVLTHTIDVPVTAAGPLRLVLQRTHLRSHETVVVTARRDEATSFDSIRSTTTLTSAWLNRRVPRTTPEALMESTGVWVQKTNHGGGSPFIRGLVGNQVLVLVDGIRLNNSTFRLGPNQYLATIDPANADAIEVVRGSGSVLYGSDALGGVVNVIARRLELADGPPEWSATLTPKYTGQSMERSGRADFEYRAQIAAVAGGVSMRAFGDLVAGGTLGVEAPSGYDEVAGDVKALVRLMATNLLTLAYQHVHQSDVPRFDQVAQRGFARYAFDPQVRRLAYARLQTFLRWRWMKMLTSTASLQDSSERRVRQMRNSVLEITEQDDVRTVGLTIEAKAAPSTLWSVVYGAEYYGDAVGSWRRDADSSLGTIVSRRGLYPDGSTAASTGAFAQGTLAWKRLTLEFGARGSSYAVKADDGRFGRTAISRRAAVASAGAIVSLSRSMNAFGSISQGFRAPNLDDLSTLGAFDFGVEVPAPGLAPERSLSHEVGVKWRTPRAAGSVAVFHSDLAGLIDRVRSTFEGAAVYEGQQVYRRSNVGRAYVRGFESEFEYRLREPLTVLGTFTYTYGHQTTTNQPVRRIPPAFGTVGAAWNVARALRAEAVLRYAGRQGRLAPGDRDDHRIAPGGTPGWRVVDVHARYAATRRLDVLAGLQNIFNEAYRVHGSGIDGPGRSLWTGAKLRF